jgi:drug/metabolite transporter (DMT)-like permease
MLNHTITVKAAIAAIILSILWGGNTPAIKIALEGVPPLALAGVRFIMGAVTVLVWVLWSRIPLKPNRQERQLLFFLLLLFVLQIYTLHAGTDFTLAAHAGVFVLTAPLFVTLLAHFFLPGDRLNPYKIAGLSLSFAGIVVIFAEGFLVSATDYLIGDAIVILSGFLLGARQVFTKTLTQSIHPARLLFWQATLSVPVFFILSLIFEDLDSIYLDTRIVLSIVYQGVIVAGLCFIFWTLLLHRYNASRLSVFGFVSPIAGVIFSHFLLGEPITNALIIGGLLVAAGIAVVNLRGLDQTLSNTTR